MLARRFKIFDPEIHGIIAFRKPKRRVKAESVIGDDAYRASA
jgi:hypothetical protein